MKEFLNELLKEFGFKKRTEKEKEIKIKVEARKRKMKEEDERIRKTIEEEINSKITPIKCEIEHLTTDNREGARIGEARSTYYEREQKIKELKLSIPEIRKNIKNKYKKNKYNLYDLTQNQQEINKLKREIEQELFECLKDTPFDMEVVNKRKQEMSSTTLHNHYKDIESPEEYRLANYVSHYAAIGHVSHYVTTEDCEKIIKYSTEGLKLNPKNAFFLYMRGRTKGDIGQFTEGIKDLNEALKLNPTFSDVFVERGRIKQAMGDIEGAAEDYEKAKEIEPTITLPEFKPKPTLEEKIFGNKKLHEIYVFHLENEEGHWYSEYCKNCEEYDGEYSNPEELYVGHYTHGKWKPISNHWKQKFGEYSPEEWIKMSKKDNVKLEITIRQEIGGTGNLIRPGSKRSLVLASGRSVESTGTVTNQIDSKSHSITIIDNSSNKTAFDEVVKMFCDEILKQLGIKIISPKIFIFESQFKDNKVTKFIFPIPTKVSEEEKLLFDIVKKNVQLKIKGVKKYEGINLIGVKKMFINSSEIVNLWNIIKNDEHLCNFDGALFLNLQILFYTCEFDYDRFTDFAKQLDKHLNISKVDSKLDYNYLTKADYVDIKKRVIDAVEDTVDEVSGEMHKDVSKRTEISKEQIQDAIKDMEKQGAVKLIYMRNYTWDIEDIKEPADSLKKLSSLMKFMQSTLKSEGEHKDFLIPTFELSTDVDFISAYGCFATINDNTGLDDSIFRIEIPNIPNRIKEL